MPGIVTPATIGWNIVSSSCRPRKYHGAFDGFGVLLKSARPSSGAFTSAEKIVRNAVTASDRGELDRRAGAARCGPCPAASALTSWIEPDLTTVSSRWV